MPGDDAAATGPSSPEWSEYVERWGLRFEEDGLPRSAGRIWGWLLVCEPGGQSLAELCDAVGVSKGTASTSTRLLEGQGLLERIPVPGSREAHYRIPPDAFRELMRRKLRATVAWRRLAEEGAGMADDDPEVAAERLRRLRDFYAFIEERQRAILRAWEGREEG